MMHTMNNIMKKKKKMCVQNGHALSENQLSEKM